VKFFADEVGPARASVMDAIQRPLIMNAREDQTGKPSWKTLPPYYMVARKDAAIPSDVEHMFAKGMGNVRGDRSSHVPKISHPDGLLSPLR
jgi:hypothetical protein